MNTSLCFPVTKNILLIIIWQNYILNGNIVNNYFTFYLNMYLTKCISIFMIESLSLEQSQIKCGEKVKININIKGFWKVAKNKLTQAFPRLNIILKNYKYVQR